jgi:polysaccharide chain length determinant protein (PEP-CTERM system associated)
MQQSEFDYRHYLALIIARKRLFVVVALAVMAAAVVYSYVLPKKYEARSTVFIEKNVISELVKGIAVTPSMEQAIKGLSEAITSRTIITKVLNDLDLDVTARSDAEIEARVRAIQQNIVIKLKGDNIFTISYVDKDPRVARDFVNTLVRRYVEENISSKREESYGAIKFLSEQIDTFRGKLDEAEGELNRYKTEKGGVIAIDEAKLFEEINVAQQKLYDIQLRRRHLEGLRPVTRKAGDPLQVKLVALQKQLEELRVSYTDSYPEVLRVKGEIETLKEQMKNRSPQQETVIDPQEFEKAEAELQALKVSEDGLKRYIATNQALLRNIPSAKAGLEKLELEKKNRKDLYDQLMARHGQSEVSKQMEVQDKTTTFRIVDPAVMPSSPISPNRVKIMLMGIVAGLGSGLGLIVLLDRLNNAVHSVDVLKGMGIPVLAVIPKIRTDEAISRERSENIRVFTAAGAFFMVILAFLVMELLNISPVDRIISRLQGMI